MPKWRNYSTSAFSHRASSQYPSHLVPIAEGDSTAPEKASWQDISASPQNADYPAASVATANDSPYSSLHWQIFTASGLDQEDSDPPEARSKHRETDPTRPQAKNPRKVACVNCRKSKHACDMLEGGQTCRGCLSRNEVCVLDKSFNRDIWYAHNRVPFQVELSGENEVGGATDDRSTSRGSQQSVATSEPGLHGYAEDSQYIQPGGRVETGDDRSQSESDHRMRISHLLLSD